MSRFVSVCLCAVAALVALLGAQLVGPTPVYAATAVVTVEAPLLQSPDHGAPLIALLPEGTVVSIDGPPVDGFYPVSSGGLSGWLVGETLSVAKDIPGEPVAEPATPDPNGEPVPAAQTAVEEIPTADPVSIPADVAQTEPVADVASAEATGDQPVTDPTAPDSVAGVSLMDDPVVVVDPPADAGAGEVAAPIAEVVSDPVTDAVLAATPVPAPSDVAVAPVPEPISELVVAPTPTQTPEPAPTGLASTVVDMPVRTGPGQHHGLIFTVPQGSTVEQTGQLEDGYVSVHYKEVVGWSAREHLGPYIEPAVETAADEAIDAKTPRPGSGVAFTSVDLSLRAGPSAAEEPLTVIPAGSRVELTGVMENDFQRVKFHGQLGWIANSYLENPPNPEPSEERNGGGSHHSYSEQQIVRIIYDAADRYGQSRQDMLRVARCESNLDPYAVNPSGSYGLFQFIRSTWKSTPFGSEDIFDPRANANAAGWMWSEGRKSEWVCQ